MWSLILHRTIIAIPMLLLVSLVSFIIIQLPPGDLLTAKIAAMEEMGDHFSLEQVDALPDAALSADGYSLSAARGTT